MKSTHLKTNVPSKTLRLDVSNNVAKDLYVIHIDINVLY